MCFSGSRPSSVIYALKNSLSRASRLLDDFLCFAVEPVVSGQERLQALKFFFQLLVLPAVVFLFLLGQAFLHPADAQAVADEENNEQ